MSDKINDGGPAFPTHDQDDGTDPRSQILSGGMSLRDYFAAKAMQAIATRTDHHCGPIDIAKEAYQQADAMIYARTAKFEDKPSESAVGK